MTPNSSVRRTFTVEDIAEDITDRADRLIERLIRQRNMCLEAFIEQVKSAAQEMADKSPYEFKPEKKEAVEIMSAFQVVHVLSFINMKNYVDGGFMADFTRYVCANLFEGDHNACIGYVKRYTELKQKDPEDQWVTFGGDVAMALAGGPSGSFFGPMLAVTAKEFTYRMWGIAADTFDDKEAVSEISKILSDMHNTRK